MTDQEGNYVTDSVTITVQPGTANCAPHAVFDSATQTLTVPFLDVPLVDPISQQEIPGMAAVFSLTLEYVPNSGGSFTIVYSSITYLPNELPDACHGKYSYDGTIYLPNVDVTTVIVLPWGNVIQGPVETYEVTLRQLMLNAAYYHLIDAVLK